MSLRDDQLDGAQIVARGTFKLDRRRAMEKLARFQLEDPHRYVLELVAAAVRAGATAIHVRNDSDDFEIGWDGAAPTAEQLDFLFDHIFTRDRSDAASSLQHLAQGVFGALGLQPRWVHIERPGARYDLTDPLEPKRTPSQRTQGMFVHVRERFGWNVVREFMNPLHAAQEAKLLQRDAWTSPVPVVVNGSDIRRELPPLTLTDDDTAYVTIVRDGIVVQREVVKLGPLRLTGAVVCDALELNASRSKVVRNKTFDTLVQDLVRQAVEQVRAYELDDHARRQAGLYLLLHHLRHATPLADEPLFRDAADRMFSLTQLRQAERVYHVDHDAPADPTWDAPHFRRGTSLQLTCLRERLRGIQDGTEILNNRHAGRVRRTLLAQMASPLEFGDDAFARRAFQHGQTRGAVALFAEPGMATIELRVDGLPVQSITTTRLPNGMRCRVGHPALQADVRFSRVLHQDPFAEVVGHCVDEGLALLARLAHERPRHMVVRQALLAWLKRCKNADDIPEALAQAKLWKRGDGATVSFQDLRQQPWISQVKPGQLAPECTYVGPEEIKLLKRLNKTLEDHTARIEDLAVAASRRTLRVNPRLGTVVTRATVRQDGLRGLVGLRHEANCQVDILHQGVPLGTHDLALPDGLVFSVEWDDAQPNARWDGLADAGQLVDLALRLKDAGHELIRQGAQGFHHDRPLSHWMRSGLETGLLSEVPLFRQTDGPVRSLSDLSPPVRVTTVPPSRAWPPMRPLFVVDGPRRDVLKRCLGAGSVEDLTHRIQERNRQHTAYRNRPVHPFVLNGAWGQELIEAQGLKGVVGICTDEREGLRVAVLAEGRLLTTLVAPSALPAVAIVRGDVEPNAGWDGLQDRSLGDALLKAAQQGAERLARQVLGRHNAPPSVMRRAMGWAPALDADLEDHGVFRTLNQGVLSLRDLRRATRVWSVPARTEADPRLTQHGVWVRADPGAIELLRKHVPSHADGTETLRQLEEGWQRRLSLGSEALPGVGSFAATWRMGDGGTQVWGGLTETGSPTLVWLVDTRPLHREPLRTDLALTIRATDDDLAADPAFRSVLPSDARKRTQAMVDRMRQDFPLALARALAGQPTEVVLKDLAGARRALIRWLGKQTDRVAPGFEGLPLVQTSDGRWLDAPALAAVARLGLIRVVAPTKTGRTLDPQRPAIPASLELRTALQAYRGTQPYDDELDRDEETLQRRESPAQRPTPSPDALRVVPLPEPWDGFVEVHAAGTSSVQLYVGWRFVESRSCPGPVPLVVHVTGDFTPDERWRSIRDDATLQGLLQAVEDTSQRLLGELLQEDADARQLPELWHRVLPRVFKHRRDVRRGHGTHGQLAELPLFVTGSGDRLSALQLVKLRKPVWVPRDLAVPARKKDRPFIVLPPQGMKPTLSFWGGIDGTEPARARRAALARRRAARRPWQLPPERWLAQVEKDADDWKVLAALHPGLGRESSLDVRVGGVAVDTWKERRWPGLTGVVEVPESQAADDFHSARRTRAQDQALDALYAQLVQQAAPEIQKSIIIQRRLAQLLGDLSNSSKARRAWLGAPLLPGPTPRSLADAKAGDVVFSHAEMPGHVCLFDDPGTRRLLAVLGIDHRTRKQVLRHKNAQRESQAQAQMERARREEEKARRRVLEQKVQLLARSLRDAKDLQTRALDRPWDGDEAQQSEWGRAWHRLDAVLVADERWADAAEVAVRAAERILGEQR